MCRTGSKRPILTLAAPGSGLLSTVLIDNVEWKILLKSNSDNKNTNYFEPWSVSTHLSVHCYLPFPALSPQSMSTFGLSLLLGRWTIEVARDCWESKDNKEGFWGCGFFFSSKALASTLRPIWMRAGWVGPKKWLQQYPSPWWDKSSGKFILDFHWILSRCHMPSATRQAPRLIGKMTHANTK